MPAEYNLLIIAVLLLVSIASNFVLEKNVHSLHNMSLFFINFQCVRIPLSKLIWPLFFSFIRDLYSRGKGCKTLTIYRASWTVKTKLCFANDIISIRLILFRTGMMEEPLFLTR